MSKTIDERVVEMRFDNRQFESNVKTSMSTLERLKQALKFPGASKSLESVGSAAKKVDFSGMSRGIETVNARFSTLQVVGMTALSNLTTAAMNAGRNIVSALTLDPVISGFQEYETQIGAVQTILANTQSKGTTLNEVNEALDELNKYADQTIYNFTEMTKNIGTFTAAGVDLDKSVTAIKGIANLAAVSGSTSAQASTAMYQLSQALAAGRVSLMDWNSVVNAGMGGELFQNALKRTAEHEGYNVDALIEKYGSFRESLTEGQWLTADVLTETLTQLSGAYTEADLIAQGYTEKQAKEIVELANTALGAATEVKTFTQLIDTAKEALGSGWAQTWEIIVGDFEDAKELFTGVSDVLSGAINASAEARNKVLKEGLGSGWDQFLDLGVGNEEYFKEVMTATAKEHGVAIDQMIADTGSFEKSLEKGWVTSDILAESLDKAAKKTEGLSKEQLKNLGYTEDQAKALQELNKNVKNGTIDLDEYAKKMSMMSGRENIIEGLKNIFNGLLEVVTPLKEAFREVFPAITGEQIYNITERFKQLTESFKISEETAQKLKSTFKGVFSVFDLIGKAITTLLSPIGEFFGSGGFSSILDVLLSITAGIGDFFTALNESSGTNNFLSAFGDGLSAGASGLASIFKTIAGLFEDFGGTLSAIGEVISNVLGGIGNALKTAFDWISKNVSAEDVFVGLAGGGIFVLAKKIGDAIGNIDELIEKVKSIFTGGHLEEAGTTFSDVLDGVHGTLVSFTNGINAFSLLAIAGAIGILSASMKTISGIDAGSVVKSLTAIGTMLVMLSFAFKSVTKTLSGFSGGSMFKASFSIIAIGAAVKIFASALKDVSDLDLNQVFTGLTALGLGLLELCGAMKLVEKSKISPMTSVSIILLAAACSILGDALKKFTGMSWDEIGRGLAAMGGALAEVSIATGALSKVGGGGALLGGTAIFIAVQALDEISENLERLSKLSWDEIGRGLAAMGGALVELGVVVGALGKLSGFSGILGAGALLIGIAGLGQLADALGKFGGMSWDQIGQGLVAMGGALAEVSVAAGALGYLTGFSGLLGAGSIFIVIQGLGQLADALKKFGEMEWDEIGRGLVSMGGALAEVSVAAGAVGGLAGFSSIFGAGSIFIVIQGLGQLADALKKFGEMEWDEIGRGLVAMGGALAEASGIPALVGSLAPLGSILGSGSLLLGVQALGPLADAFESFAGNSWEEIGKGLVAMGGALAEATGIPAIVGSLSPLGQLAGSGSLGLAVQSLGDLASAFEKFGNMQWDEIGRGLASMAGAMGATGLGSLLNTFSGIGAGALQTAASSLGPLAEAVNKWKDVELPSNLSTNLSDLAGAVQSFSFAFLGGWSMSAATSLGPLAEAVKKWKDVELPSSLKNDLDDLSNGIQSFTLSFAGGWSIGAINEPLSTLAESVAKWQDVDVPDNIKTDLQNLAAGIGEFTLTGFASFGVGSAVDGLNDLYGAVSKWDGITVQADIGTALTGLATGLKEFDGLEVDFNSDLSDVSSSISSVSGNVAKIAEIDWSGATAQMQAFADAIDGINFNAAIFSAIGDQMVEALTTSLFWGQFAVAAAAQNLVDSAVTAFTLGIILKASSLSSVGENLVESLVSGLSSGAGSALGAVSSLLGTLSGYINGQSGIFMLAGIQLSSALGAGLSVGALSISGALSGAISSLSSQVLGQVPIFTQAGFQMSSGLYNGLILGGMFIPNALSGALSAAAASARSYQGSFFSAGVALAQGLANGISSGRSSAINAAASMAQAAANRARAILAIHSPSRVFRQIGEYIPQGMAIGIDNYRSAVVAASSSMANSAISGANTALNALSTLSDIDLDSNPTITPVLDLSNVQNGVGAIDSMLSTTVPLNLLGQVDSINAMMNQRIQNGTFNDVVSGLDKVRKSIDKLERPSYTVNGITYDDGSNITGAVETLVRAARLERRI